MAFNHPWTSSQGEKTSSVIIEERVTGDCESAQPFLDEDISSSSSTSPQLFSSNPEFPTPPPRRKTIFWLVYLNIITIVILVITLIKIGSQSSTCVSQTTSSREALKLASAWSPLFDQVDLTPELFTVDGRLHSTSNSSIFRGEPSEETDAAWDDISAEANEVILVDADTLKRAGYNPRHYFKAPPAMLAHANKSLDEELFPVQIDTFHQIHCLNAVRKQMYYDHYFSAKFPDGPDEMHWMHLRHCLHMVLQSLTCSADVDIVPHRWVEKDDVPFAQFGITKKCRNFENLRKWNTQHAVRDVRKVWPKDKRDMPHDAFVWSGFGEGTLEGEGHNH